MLHRACVCVYGNIYGVPTDTIVLILRGKSRATDTFSAPIAVFESQRRFIIRRFEAQKSQAAAAIDPVCRGRNLRREACVCSQLYPPQFAKTDSHLARAAGSPRTDYAKRSNVTITIRWRCSGVLARLGGCERERRIRSPPRLPLAELQTPRGVISGLAPRGPPRAHSARPGWPLLAALQKTRGNRKLRLASESITRYLERRAPGLRAFQTICSPRRFLPDL